MTFPLQRYYTRTGAAVAAGADLRTIVGKATDAETVIGVEYIPSAAVTGADTNSRTVTLFRRGSDGTGTTVVAQLALTNGINMADNVPKVITLSGTAANLNLAASEVMEWESLHVGTGIADPGGLVRVTTRRTGSAA